MCVQGNTCDYAYRNNFIGDHVGWTALLEVASGTKESGEEVTFESTKRWLGLLHAGQRRDVPSSKSRGEQ